MSNEYTSLEVSKRIKEVGIELSEYRCGYKVGDTEGMLLVMTPEHTAQYMVDINIPAYTAQQAFDWLMKNNKLYIGDSDGNFGFRVIGFYQEDCVTNSLADMLWSAIIWIKENEDE